MGSGERIARKVKALHTLLEQPWKYITVFPHEVILERPALDAVDTSWKWHTGRRGKDLALTLNPIDGQTVDLVVGVFNVCAWRFTCAFEVIERLQIQI